MTMSIKHMRLALAAGVALSALISGNIVAQTVAQGAPITRPQLPVAGTAGEGLSSAEMALREGRWVSAIEQYGKLVNAQDPEERAKARYGLAVALSQMGQDDKALQALEGTLADESALGRAVGELRGRLLLQLADKALAEQGSGAAGKWLSQYERLTGQPDALRYERIRGAGEIVGSQNEPSLVLKVAVLLPQDGNLKAVGEGILRGVQLGLRDFDGRRGTRVEMTTYAANDAPSARAAADKALAEGADVIVGPLTAQAVTAVKEGVAGKVPVLALSSDRTVMGGGVHTLNYLPTEQARMVARHAMRNGQSRVAGLVPSTPYGYEVFDAFQDEVKQLGGTVVGSSFYNPANNDIGASIRTLVDSVSGTTASFSVPFDALFLPAPAPTLPLVVSQLSYYDIDKAKENGRKTQLLGTALWQDPVLLGPGASGARGGIFAVPPRMQAFEQTYKDSFKADPHPLAVLGYDAMRVLTDVAAEKQRTGKSVGDLLMRPEGFYGTGGYVAFKEGGLTERGLSLVKVGQQFEVEKEALPLRPLPIPDELQPSGRRRGWW